MKPLIYALCSLLVACTIDGTTEISHAQAQSADPCAVETGEFAVTSEGFTDPAPTGMVIYKLFPCVKLAYLLLPKILGGSNSSEFTLGPLPGFLIPETIPWQEHPLNGVDNGIEQSGISVVTQAGNGNLTLGIHGDGSGWTSSGEKGAGLQVITIFLD